MPSPLLIAGGAALIWSFLKKKAAIPPPPPPASSVVPRVVPAGSALKAIIGSEAVTAMTASVVPQTSAATSRVLTALQTATGSMGVGGLVTTTLMEWMMGPVGWAVSAATLLYDLLAFVFAFAYYRSPADAWLDLAKQGGCQFVVDSMRIRVFISEMAMFERMLNSLRDMKAPDGSQPYKDLTWKYNYLATLMGNIANGPYGSGIYDMYHGDAKLPRGYVQQVLMQSTVESQNVAPPNDGKLYGLNGLGFGRFSLGGFGAMNTVYGAGPNDIITKMYTMARALALQEAFSFNHTMFSFFSSKGMGFQQICDNGLALTDPDFGELAPTFAPAKTQVHLYSSCTTPGCDILVVPNISMLTIKDIIQSDPTGKSLWAISSFLGNANAAAFCAATDWGSDDALKFKLMAGLNWCVGGGGQWLIDGSTGLGMNPVLSRDSNQLVAGCWPNKQGCNPIPGGC